MAVLENRSVPPDTILPHVEYQDLPAAIDWLTKTFGFVEHYRYGEPVSGAQLHIGNAWVMVRQADRGTSGPARLGYGTQSLTVFVDEVEEHYQRTKAAGGKIVEDLHITEYGEQQYGVVDLDGHHWLFSRHARDISPDAWGARIAQPAFRPKLLRRPRICYLEIPAVDIGQSVAFYEKVFGWNIRHRDTPRPSFDDATGNVSGAWVTGREIARKPTLLPYIWVDNIDATLAHVTAHGGQVAMSPQRDTPGDAPWIASFRDPAGNILGLYQEGPRAGIAQG